MFIGPDKVFTAENVSVPEPLIVSPPAPLRMPEMVALPLPATVSKLPPLTMFPETVRRLLEFVSHCWAPPNVRGALIVRAPAPGSSSMPVLGLIPTVVPLSVSALPLMVMAPLPVSQRPPTEAVAVRPGWLLYDAFKLNRPTSLPPGAVPPQFEAALQAVPELLHVQTAAPAGTLIANTAAIPATVATRSDIEAQRISFS